MELRYGGISRVSPLRLTTLLLTFRPYEGSKVLFRMVGRPAGRLAGRSGFYGTKTNSAQSEAGARAELGKKEQIIIS